MPDLTCASGSDPLSCMGYEQLINRLYHFGPHLQCKQGQIGTLLRAPWCQCCGVQPGQGVQDLGNGSGYMAHANLNPVLAPSSVTCSCNSAAEESTDLPSGSLLNVAGVKSD